MTDFPKKDDFQLLTTQSDLVYLDSAATSQKPKTVIEAVNMYYQKHTANVHRGIYRLSEEATQLFEDSRAEVRAFLNAKYCEEIIFTKNATEAINIVARSYGANTKVLLSVMEHHANIVPWQLVMQKNKKSTNEENKFLETINITEDFRLDLEDYKAKLARFKPDIVAITHASNVLGTINPVKEICKLAHEAGAKVLVDGAQAIPHLPIDVQDLDADYYVFSAHKMFGPTGVGVLYGKKELLENTFPLLGGGEMISEVLFNHVEYNKLPWKLEAGTPHIAGVLGLQAAISYINTIGFDEIRKHEEELGKYTLEKLNNIEGLEIFGPRKMIDRLAVFSFTLRDIHVHDIASLLDEESIAIRAGHHCAMPLHVEVLNISATARASLSIYNSKSDIDKLVNELKKIIKKFE